MTLRPPSHAVRPRANRRSIACCASLLAVISMVAPAKSADFYWDPDGEVLFNRLNGFSLGGSGTWDTTTASWWDGLYRNSAWDNAGFHHAWFTGTGGTVNASTALTAGALTIQPSAGGYVFTGSAITFNTAGVDAQLTKVGLSTATLNNNLVLGKTTVVGVDEGFLTLRGVISGTGGLTKNGNGTLILANTTANTYTGVTTLNGGITLALPQGNNVNALGANAAGQHTIINAGATFATSNDLDNATPGTQSTGGWGTINEAFTIHGDGYLNMGALRKMIGREQDTLGGAITMGSAARLHSDYGTLAITGAFNISQTLTATGASGFVSLSGVNSGSADILHYGLSGFRLQNDASTYSGTITSTLGEIRGDTGNTTTGVNAYSNLTALNLRNSALRLNFPNGAGTAPNVANSRFSTTAPIAMRASAINLENAAFNGTASNLFTYDAAQALGVTTLEGGGNKIYFRSSAAAAGSVTLTFANILRPNAGTMLEFQIDSLTTGELGASAKHRVLNTTLEAGSTVPFVGGWAFYDREFLKYVPASASGNGYRKLETADQAVDTATNTWTAGQNIRITSGDRTLGAGTTTIQSLNLRSTTARTLTGPAGSTLVVDSGGILTSDATHTISVPFLTAGAGDSYHLNLIAWNSNVIRSSIVDNGVNPVSLVKAGGNTSSFLSNNTYTGSTILVEGNFREIIGARNFTALGGGNLNMTGDVDSQATYESDRPFTRALGSGVGQVQLVGGGGMGGGSVGFSAFGAPVSVNFGNNGSTVTWGSTHFNPGIFTLNGGNATHVVTLVNGLNLGGEQRYIRIDGSSSAGNRAAIGIVAGDLLNGGIVKRGGGMLVFEDAKSYTGGTVIQEGELWLRKTGTTLGTAGANVSGNDIMIGNASRLKIDDPASIGSRQWIILQNGDDNNASAITFGAGYGDGSAITFHGRVGALSPGVLKTGAYDIFLANQQTGNDRRNRVGIQISGNHAFSADLVSQIKTIAPDVEVWFGADTGNGTYTGTTLGTSGRTKTGGTQAFRLGTGGGTLTIANANVLTGAFPLIVGAEDNTGRSNIGGVVFLPQGQNYTGTVTQSVGPNAPNTTVVAGNLIGAGGILIAGSNGALNSGNNNVSLRGGELRLVTDPSKAYMGQTDTQYSSRNLFVTSATGTFRNFAIGGGYGGEVQLNQLTMRMDDADRIFSLNSTGTNYMKTVFNGTVTLENGATARDAFFDVGTDNSFQSGLGVLVFNEVIGQTGAGSVGIQKRNGGALILNADNTYNGATNIQQGRLVIGHVGAAGNAGSNINFNTNNDRRSDLEFRFNGTGPFVVNNIINTTGGNNGSTRVITVGPMSGLASTNQEVRVTSLVSNAGGDAATGASNGPAIFFDGFNGYRFTVTGATTLTRTFTDFRTRGALVTLDGPVGGAGALHKYEQGSLRLNGNNTYTGATNVYNGFLVLGHDNALGNTTSAVTFNGGSFSQVLASGTRTITRNFTNSASGSAQTIGGLDAGAKTFSGNIALTSREIWLTAAAGDVSFTGTISGGNAINKVGSGTVILGTAGGTGNTYTGTTNIFGGTLVGLAGASGSPFGASGAITLSNGGLVLQGGSSARTVTAGALNLNLGNATITVNGSSAATQLTFTTINRTNNGTLVLKGASTDLGTAGAEKVTFTTVPDGNQPIWSVVQGNGTNAAHYVGISGGNVVTANYGGSGDLDTATGPNQLFDAGNTGGTLTESRSVFAFRSNAAVDLGGFTLNLGAGGQAGILLNHGADITGTSGSRIALGTNRLSLYTDNAAVSTLNVPIGNYRDNVNTTLSSSNVAAAAAFLKFGPGTLEIAAPQTFQGNISVNQGTLSLTSANVVPTFTNLSVMTGSIVTVQPGASILLNGNDQEFGHLAGVSPASIGGEFQHSGGVVDLGGATLTVGREGSNQVFNGQLIGGTGSVLRKIGGGTLSLFNYNGNMPNSLGTLQVDQGTLSSRNNDQSWATPTAYASAIPSSTSVELRGGTWQVRVVGDSTTNYQAINLGNNISVQGGNGVVSTVRDQGGASNKIVVFNNLTLRQWLLTITGDNSNFSRFDGTLALERDARIQTDSVLALNGPITGNYTLTKTGGSNLEVNSDNSGWKGGTVLHDGTLIFGGRFPERTEYYMGGTNLGHYSATANLGTGDIVVNRSTAIRINTPANILTGAGQRVQTFGSAQNSQARVDLGLDAPLADYGIRSTSNGNLALGLNDGFWTRPLDQAMLGNGRWGLSAWSTTYYTPATLGAGIDNVYRFAGTNGGALGLTSSHVLTGTASVQVGSDMVPNGFAIGNGNASVRFYGDQSYTGNTTIFRNRETGSTQNFLEFTGSLATPVIDVYARLAARGAGRFTAADGTQANLVNLYPGASLRLDYSMDVNDTFLISRLENTNLGLSQTENKWADDQPMLLDGATLNLINSSGRVNRERVGAITVRNGASVFLERSGTNGQMVLETPSVTRSGQATFAVRENADELGRVDLQSLKFFIDNGSTMLDAWGLMPVWMVNPSRNTFLTYSNDLGVQNAAFTQSTTTTVNADAQTFLNGLTATSVASLLGGADPTLTGTIDVHALRVGTVAGNETTFTGGTIRIRSGGLISQNADAIGRVNFNTTNLYFGDGTTPVEAVIYNAVNNITTRMGGVVTAANLTMHGIGNLQLTNTGNQITGNIQINSGKLFLDGAGTAGSATITLGGDWVQNNDGQQMAELNLRTNNNANTVWGNAVIVPANLPYARIIGSRYTGSATGVATNTIPGLTVGGTSTLQGTSLIIGNTSGTDSANTHDLHVSGATSFGGTSAIGLRVEQGGRIFRLEGAVTGSAPLIKSGDGILRLDANNTGLTSAVTLNRGEIRGVGNNANNFFGTGNYLLNFGTLRFSSGDAARTYFNSPGQTLTFGGGAVSLVRDRNGGANSNLNLTIGAVDGDNVIRTTGGSDIRIQSDSFGDNWVFESKFVVNDSSTLFNDNASVWLRDQLEGSGRLTRLGIWYLYFENNAPNTNWTGTLDLQAGQTRMLTNNDTLGGVGSSVIIHPTAALILRTVGNLGTGNGITELRTTSATSHTVLGIGLATEFAALRSYYNGLTTIGNRNGALVLSATSISTDPDMANFQNGNWLFGAGNGDGSLVANSVAPWGPGGNEFRIGGGGSTLTLNPGTAGAQFAGAGNRMVIGSANNTFGFINAVFGNNANNTYDGGTLLLRSRNMDGAYRGAVIRISGGQANATTYRTPLGTGTVDVFGVVRFEGSTGTARGSDTTNANSWVFHPGSKLEFDNGSAFGVAGTQGRWADNVAITLNGAVLEMYGNGGNNPYNSETIGNLTVERGAEVVLRRRGSNWSEIVAGDLARTGNATLMITGMVDTSNNSTSIGVAGTASAMRLLVNNGATFMANNMVAPWIIDRAGSQFMKYDATLGFQSLLTGGTPANYVSSAGGTLTLATNDGTRILSIGTATATLGANLDIHALRTDRDINVSADGQFNRIIIRSGGLTQFGSTTPTINADLHFGSALGDGEALLHSSNNILQLNGKIHASRVTKFGTSELYIRSDQPQFTGNWVVNGGRIRFLTGGAPGSGEIILNGSRANDRDNTFNLTEILYGFNNGSPDLFTYTGGKITAYDMNRIYANPASDRLLQIPDIDLRTTNTVAGTGQEGTILFQVDNARTILRTGTVTLHDHYFALITSGSYTSGGSTTGVQFGSGTGAGGLNNQGLYDFRRGGPGLLILGDNSTSFTGAGRSMIFGEGGVRVTHAGSFGSSQITASIEQGASLEIAVPGWTPLATLEQQPGSMERWAVDGARPGAVHNMPSGVHLQVFHNQTGTQVIGLDGGSIMGYLPRDWDHVGIIQQLGPDITINLISSSYLGQPYSGSNNSLWDRNRIYDLGKINQVDASNPNDGGLRGSYLQIHGTITGAGGITKLGEDMILLTGANTYAGPTVIENGILQIGRNNSLPVGTDLVMKTSSGMFDLNGYDQTVASLSGPNGSINNGAFQFNTLTVNQAGNSTYGGSLDGNVNLTKAGAGILTLSGTNTLRGTVTVSGGTLRLAGTPGANKALPGDGRTGTSGDIVINGGTLEVGASEQIGDNASIVMDSGAFNFGSGTGRTETIGSFTNQGGDFSTGANTLIGTGDSITFAGGTNTVNSGGEVRDAHVLITGGTNTVEAGGTLHVTGGGTGLEFGGTSSPSLALASDDATPGVLRLSGNLSVLPGLTSGTATISSSGTGTTAGTVDLDGGVRTVTVANGSDATDLHISARVTNGGLVKTGAGTLRLSGENTYQGGTVVTGGAVSVGSQSHLGAAPAGFEAGHLTLDGGTLHANGTFAIDQATRGITLGANGGILDVDNGRTLTLATVVSGDSGDLIKVGDGTLVLTGANTYSDSSNSLQVNHGTYVRAGTVLVNNTSGSGTGDGDVLVTGAATLGGHGAIAGNVDILAGAGATLTAGYDGNTDRTLDIGGDLTINSGNTWFIDLVQNVDGAVSRIDVGGNLVIGSNVNLVIAYHGNFTAGHSYILSNYTSGLSGVFNTLGNDAIFSGGGGEYQIRYADNGNYITLTAVPEPGTIGLLGLGLGGLLARRLRRRRPLAETGSGEEP